MNILVTLTVFDYIIAGCGALCVILAIAQLCTKKCIGISKMYQYTDESARKLSVVSSIIYLFGGIITAASPFAVAYINLQNLGFTAPTALPRWIFFVVIALILVAQLTTLKKKQ